MKGWDEGGFWRFCMQKLFPLTLSYLSYHETKDFKRGGTIDMWDRNKSLDDDPKKEAPQNDSNGR